MSCTTSAWGAATLRTRGDFLWTTHAAATFFSRNRMHNNDCSIECGPSKAIGVRCSVPATMHDERERSESFYWTRANKEMCRRWWIFRGRASFAGSVRRVGKTRVGVTIHRRRVATAAVFVSAPCYGGGAGVGGRNVAHTACTATASTPNGLFACPSAAAHTHGTCTRTKNLNPNGAFSLTARLG